MSRSPHAPHSVQVPSRRDPPRAPGGVRGRLAAIPLVGLVALAASLPSGCGRVQAREPRPDVIVIVVDTLRADRLGCYGGRETSPTIDSLAEEGALFERVTAQASWTLTSMTSMWTGRYLTDHREFPDESWPVLAEAFRSAGYRTVGSSANALLTSERGFGRGFDVYDSRAGHDGEGGYRPAEQLVSDLWEPIDRALTVGPDGSRPPLFLYLQPIDPHHPYHSHLEYEAELPRMGARPFEPEGWHEEQLAEFGPPPPRKDPGWRKALLELRVMRGTYEQEIRYVDEQIGSLLAGLAERGVLENAIVAVVSDHGEGLWDHLAPVPPERLKKTPPVQFFFQSHGYNLYQEAIATPFVLWGRGVPFGRRYSEPVENVDLFPTLLELADVPAPGPLDGRSLVGLLTGDDFPARRYTYSFVRQCAAVLDHATGLKLIEPTAYGRKKGLRSELYRFEEDPFERVDLAAELPEEVERLRAVITRWRETHPTRSTLGTRRTPEELRALRKLGYTAEHAPGLDGQAERSEPAADE